MDTNATRPAGFGSSVKVMGLDGLRAAAGAKVNWLWRGYLAPGTVTLLTSQWKAGKTTLLAILLDRMRQGGDLAGLPVRAGRAVVLSEESPALWSSRSEKFDFGTHVCWVCRPFRGKPRPAQWLGLIDDLVTLHGEQPFDLLAIDPLASFLPGRSENSADAVLDALLPLQRLTERGVAVLGQHHPRKKAGPAGTAARGSGALSGHADILIEMHWQGEPSETDRRRRLYAWSRHEETPRQLVIELNPAGTDYEALAESETPFLSIPPPLLAILRGRGRS
jgi:AAA domain-containing protein